MSLNLSILTENPELAKNIKLELTGADLLAFGEVLHRLAVEEGNNTNKEPEKYLTPQELADALHVSLVTLWHWDNKGITRPLRIGTKKRYRRSDIEKILQSEERQ
jgi:predicted DNA-binding transcriptional regulator AlpA